MNNTTFLYGFGGVDENYRVIKFAKVDQQSMQIATLTHEAYILKMDNPKIKEVIAVDGCRGLTEAYFSAKRRPTVDNCVLFKLICEGSGIKIDI